MHTLRYGFPLMLTIAISTAMPSLARGETSGSEAGNQQKRAKSSLRCNYANLKKQHELTLQQIYPFKAQPTPLAVRAYENIVIDVSDKDRMSCHKRHDGLLQLKKLLKDQRKGKQARNSRTLVIIDAMLSPPSLDDLKEKLHLPEFFDLISTDIRHNPTAVGTIDNPKHMAWLPDGYYNRIVLYVKDNIFDDLSVLKALSTKIKPLGKIDLHLASGVVPRYVSDPIAQEAKDKGRLPLLLLLKKTFVLVRISEDRKCMLMHQKKISPSVLLKICFYGGSIVVALSLLISTEESSKNGEPLPPKTPEEILNAVRAEGFVGNDKELKRLAIGLSDRSEKLFSGKVNKPDVTLFIGREGVGKTRLMTILARLLGQKNPKVQSLNAVTPAGVVGARLSTIISAKDRVLIFDEAIKALAPRKDAFFHRDRLNIKDEILNILGEEAYISIPRLIGPAQGIDLTKTYIFLADTCVARFNLDYDNLENNPELIKKKVQRHLYELSPELARRIDRYVFLCLDKKGKLDLLKQEIAKNFDKSKKRSIDVSVTDQKLEEFINSQGNFASISTILRVWKELVNEIKLAEGKSIEDSHLGLFMKKKQFINTAFNKKNEEGGLKSIQGKG